MKIKYNIHIKNDEEWPGINEDACQIGNYAEWEAEEWELENGDIPPEYEDLINQDCARINRLLSKCEIWLNAGEVLRETLDTDKNFAASQLAKTRHAKNPPTAEFMKTIAKKSRRRKK